MAQFVNLAAPFEPLDDEALFRIDGGWRRIVSELGIQFDDPEALRLFAEAGQHIDGTLVRFDPDFLLDHVALAPAQFDLLARNPARDVTVGHGHTVFLPAQGAPFVRRDGVRRDGTLADFEDLVRLAHHLDDLDSPGGLPCEPNDRPLDSRHLDMTHALFRFSDKPIMGAQISAVAARDSIAMARIVFGERFDEGPCLHTVINVNSPLRYDGRMIEALLEHAAAGSAVVVTPFLLMGAMAPVTVAAALAQQTAEALAGIALVELVHPGCPVILGSFLSNTDMKNGSPGFGGPETAVGLLASGQLARRLGVPWRSGGGALTSSPVPDAQAAYEGTITMTAALHASANMVMHTTGWLEGGLTVGFEKVAIDVEIVRTLRAALAPLSVDDSALAFDAHAEVGHGGHFFGAEHTLERFRDCFYRPVLSTTDNFERWTRMGSLDAAARARTLVEEWLAAYEQPPLPDDVAAELDEYVERRRRELGD
jgi:trimethylamine---corrinoid protein Co-methyltransferase